ncbi:MAG TPA: cytidylate kinase family protein [Myxococcota bacterium]|nr:cytidylate kinase family protein [Myxococcota bacterium]
MQIICLSRGTFAGGKKLAEALAAKLGSDCLAREELTDAATGAGIPVGKLEMNIVHRRPMSEQLAIEKERYKAFVTATLCERALKNNLVYHGRTGHLVLPGVTHVLRVRAIMDPEQRIQAAMQRLRLEREKARKYIEEVDEDRRRWVRGLYNTDWHDPGSYDIVINLSHINVENAAAGLLSMAQLPEFQATPAALQAVSDLWLAARCRLAIGADQRTGNMDVKVRSDRGLVSATYLPRDASRAGLIPEVLSKIEGIGEVLCTMASTNVLWVQERFDPQGESLDQVLQVAGRWNAAVELVQLKEEGGQEEPAQPRETGEASETGGILDDSVVESDSNLDEGMRKTRERLISAGRAGGYRVLSGGPQELLANIDRTVAYNLVVVGELCVTKGAAVSKRRTQEMVSYLNDSLHMPVIEAADMRSQFMFGPAQLVKLLVFAGLTVLLFILVMTHQEEVLGFISRGTCFFTNCKEVGSSQRILSAAVVVVFVPIFAFCYGGFTRFLFRLLRFG